MEWLSKGALLFSLIIVILTVYVIFRKQSKQWKTKQQVTRTGEVTAARVVKYEPTGLSKRYLDEMIVHVLVLYEGRWIPSSYTGFFSFSDRQDEAWIPVWFNPYAPKHVHPAEQNEENEAIVEKSRIDYECAHLSPLERTKWEAHHEPSTALIQSIRLHGDQTLSPYEHQLATITLSIQNADADVTRAIMLTGEEYDKITAPYYVALVHYCPEAPEIFTFPIEFQ